MSLPALFAENPFLVRAVAAVVLASIAIGVVSTLAVINRLVSMGGGLAHSAYGGIGLAILFGAAPLPFALAFVVASAFLMGFIEQRAGERADTAIGVVWALGMAFGILCIDLSRAYTGDLMAILFGSLLSVTDGDLWSLLALDVVLVAGAWRLRHEWLALAIDPEYAAVSGVPVRALRYAMLAAMAFAIVLLMRIVGLVLMVALLAIPGALATRWTRAIGPAMIACAAVSLVCGLGGLALSWRFDLSSGASIIAVSGVVFFAASLLRGMRRA